MQITDIRIRRITKEGKMKAVVSITFDNAFVVHDIKIIEGEKGLFIAMPRDISLIGFDAVPPVSLSDLELTIVKGTHTRRHTAAIKHLLRRIEDEETEIIRVYYRTRLQEGNSIFDKTRFIYT